MIGSVDLVRFLYRSMVKPEDDVAIFAVLVIEIRPSDTHRLVGISGENGEGACCIESDPLYAVTIDVVICQGFLNRPADAVPDIGG